MKTAMRVVSLVPSLTETAEFLKPGCVVGLTRFCIHPVGLRKKATVIGGTKDPDIARILSLKPDLILANHEENQKEDVEALENAGIPVLTTRISTVTEALAEIQRLGRALDVFAASRALCDEIAAIETPVCTRNIRTAYFIWKDPWMAAGGDTFISDVMERFGLANVFGDRARYPIVSPEMLDVANTQLVLLSSEPFPFKERHRNELSAQVAARVERIDGEWFSWYGVRMLKSFQALAQWRAGLNLY
jgi:ABC-type Fe3+-hydroxamate transport system substrate-binding protein